MDDAEVIRASLRDAEAFGEIFERHYDAISRYARSRVGEAAGEDIASRAFLIAFERRHRFDPKASSAMPWLLGIATNLVRHHARDERTHLTALTRLPTPLVQPDTSDDPTRLDALRLRKQLREALLDLPRVDRDAFLLNVLAELTYDEVAASLAIPVGTVRSRIHRARMALRERFSSDTGITDDG